MQLAQCISIGDKKVTITGTLPEDKVHLVPLFDLYFNALADSVGASLENLGLVKTTTTVF